MAVKAAAAEVLGLLGRGVVGVLYREAGVWGEVGHGHGRGLLLDVVREVLEVGMARLAVEGGLGGDDDGSWFVVEDV